jgi:hypothetical protein
MIPFQVQKVYSRKLIQFSPVIHITAAPAVPLWTWANHLIPLLSSLGFPLNPETSYNSKMKLEWNFKITDGILLNETTQYHTARVATVQLASYM